MGRASRDANRVPVLIGGSTADSGATPIILYVDPDTHRLYVDVNTGGTPVKDNETVNADDYGVLSLGTDGSNYQILKVDSDGHLQVDILTAPNIPTGIGHGVKTVTTAGTDVALASSTACKRIVIQAQTDNTGLIAVGGSGVDATEATGTGIILEAGDVFELEIDNLADVYIDSTVNGEGVRFTYFT